MPPPTCSIANEATLTSLLTLGAIWHRHLCLRVTITLTSETPTSTALSFRPVKRADIASHPAHTPEDEYREEFYASTDPVAQLWTGFYHMMEERDEKRILGPYYTAAPTLLEKLRLLHADFLARRPVHVFLSDLFIADEFACDGAPSNALSVAIDALRNLAYVRSPFAPAAVAAREQRPTPPEMVHRVSVPPHAEAAVDVSGYAVHTVVFEPDDDVDGAAAQAAADMIQRESHARTGAGIDGRIAQSGQRAPPKLCNAFAWEIPVSELAKSEAVVPDSPSTQAALKRYARVSSAVFKVASRRTKSCLEGMGIAQPDMLRYVAEYVGKEQAVWFAAVEDVGGVQRGVRDLSYSAFEEDQMVGEAGSVAATVAGLRDVGRVGFMDNVVEQGVAGEVVGKRVVVEAENGDGLTTVPFDEAKVVEGRLPDELLVR